jgi:outer membrane protein OmpA-like peptidoglycan-associated protein
MDSAAARYQDPVALPDTMAIELPIENVAPVAQPAELPADCIETFLRLTDFSSFGDLESNPQSLSLQIDQRHGQERLFDVEFALFADSLPVAHGRRALSFTGRSRRFEANRLIDFRSLETSYSKTTPLPTGHYRVRLGIAAGNGALRLHNEATFDHVNLESLFGLDAPRARYLIATGKARTQLEADGEIVFNVFGDGRAPGDMARASSCAAQRNEHATTVKDDDRCADAAPIAPVSMNTQEKRTWTLGAVRNAFSRAMSLDSWIKRARASRQPIGIVITEVYFPFDGAELNDEARSLLELVSRELNRHPELSVEVRGYADDLRDAGYDLLLAQRRSQRVHEFLGRKQVSETRMRAAGFGTRFMPRGDTPAQRQRNRRVQVVLITGK